MGVESFFINAKLNRLMDMGDIKVFLDENSFLVSPYEEKYGCLFRKKRIIHSIIVVDNVVELNISDGKNLSLMACFTCYKKARNIMSEIIFSLHSSGYIKYAYYGDRKFFCKKADKEELDKWIRDTSVRRCAYFRAQFTDKEFDILPNNDFYEYYRKHRHYLKMIDTK